MHVHACDHDRRSRVTNDIINFKMADSIVRNDQGSSQVFISLRQNWGYSGSRGHKATARGRVQEGDVPPPARSAE